MVEVFTLLWFALASLLRSRVRLEAEILILRQQINVLRRNSPKRFAFRTLDRLVFVGVYRLVLSNFTARPPAAGGDLYGIVHDHFVGPSTAMTPPSRPPSGPMS